MPFIINALATLEIKTFMKRRDDNGLFVNVSASKPARGRGEQDCAAESPGNTAWGERLGLSWDFACPPSLVQPTQSGPASQEAWESFRASELWFLSH